MSKKCNIVRVNNLGSFTNNSTSNTSNTNYNGQNLNNNTQFTNNSDTGNGNSDGSSVSTKNYGVIVSAPSSTFANNINFLDSNDAIITLQGGDIVQLNFQHNYFDSTSVITISRNNTFSPIKSYFRGASSVAYENFVYVVEAGETLYGLRFDVFKAGIFDATITTIKNS